MLRVQWWHCQPPYQLLSLSLHSTSFYYTFYSNLNTSRWNVIELATATSDDDDADDADDGGGNDDDENDQDERRQTTRSPSSDDDDDEDVAARATASMNDVAAATTTATTKLHWQLATDAQHKINIQYKKKNRKLLSKDFGSSMNSWCSIVACLISGGAHASHWRDGTLANGASCASHKR